MNRRRSKSKISGIHRLTTGRKIQMLLVFLLAQAMFFYSDRFRIHHLTVIGNTRVKAVDVARATGLQWDKAPHLTELSLPAVQSRVEDMLWVQQAQVGLRWPGELLVRVTERHPVAVVALDDARPTLSAGGWRNLAWYSVDSAGLVLSRVAGADKTRLPRILVQRPLRIHKHMGTLAIDKVLAWAPVLRQACGNRIEYFEVDPMGQVSFVTPLVGKPTLVRIGTPERELQVEVLRMLCQRIEREHRPVDYVDLRFAYPAIRYPAATTPGAAHPVSRGAIVQDRQVALAPGRPAKAGAASSALRR
ncbi:MAG TPA: FtsQ-type POTRA domain-containing protein [Candidatus Xenobia bacterium]|jgi:hypothetical protein